MGVVGMVFGAPGVAFRVPGVRGERERGRRTWSETGLSATLVDFPPVDFRAVFFLIVWTIAGKSGWGDEQILGEIGRRLEGEQRSRKAISKVSQIYSTSKHFLRT